MNKNESYKSKVKQLIEIGGSIRKKRLLKGWTMMDLSFETDIDYRQIGRIERGETNFTIVTLNRICDALNVKLKDIIK